jgi:hypothetical protein
MELIVAARLEQKVLEAKARMRSAATRISIVLLCLELTAFIFGVAGAWLMLVLPPTERVAGFSYFVALFVSIQFAAYGIHKGNSWARLGGIALLSLSVASVAFPFAAVGLWYLTDKRTWSAYLRQRTTVG